MGGNVIGVPPGKKCHVFSDGTNMDFVNVPESGTAYDLHGATALPSWMTACSVLPYLIKDGSIYNNTAYLSLASVLQNQFGGTPGLSFAVPDELARARIGVDTVGTNRLTTGGSGVSGITMGSAGGSQFLQSHVHSVSIAAGQGSHSHGANSGGNFMSLDTGTVFGTGVGTGGVSSYLSGTTAPQTLPAMSGTAAATGGGNSSNVQPAIVSFLPLIKT